MNDITIQFAILWGQTIGHAAHSNDPEKIALGSYMKGFSSMELMEMFCEWQQEYSEDRDSWEYDTVAFFEAQMEIIKQQVSSQTLTR